MPTLRSTRKRTAGGLLVESAPGWRLSLRGWLLAGGLLIGVFAAGLVELYPFLAVTRRVPTDILVIDGWLPTFDLGKAAEEFRSGGYRSAIVVRASYGYEAVDQDPGNLRIIRVVLTRYGIPDGRLTTLTFPGQRKDRTRGAALAVRDWFDRQGQPLTSLDLFTQGPHARRSRLVYRRTLGRTVSIGVIAAPDPSYDKDSWWNFSDGIREVPFEGLAYLYAACSIPAAP